MSGEGLEHNDEETEYSEHSYYSDMEHPSPSSGQNNSESRTSQSVSSSKLQTNLYDELAAPLQSLDNPPKQRQHNRPDSTGGTSRQESFTQSHQSEDVTTWFTGTWTGNQSSTSIPTMGTMETGSVVPSLSQSPSQPTSSEGEFSSFRSSPKSSTSNSPISPESLSTRSNAWYSADDDDRHSHGWRGSSSSTGSSSSRSDSQKRSWQQERSGTSSSYRSSELTTDHNKFSSSLSSSSFSRPLSSPRRDRDPDDTPSYDSRAVSSTHRDESSKSSSLPGGSGSQSSSHGSSRRHGKKERGDVRRQAQSQQRGKHHHSSESLSSQYNSINEDVKSEYDEESFEQPSHRSIRSTPSTTTSSQNGPKSPRSQRSRQNGTSRRMERYYEDESVGYEEETVASGSSHYEAVSKESYKHRGGADQRRSSLEPEVLPEKTVEEPSKFPDESSTNKSPVGSFEGASFGTGTTPEPLAASNKNRELSTGVKKMERASHTSKGPLPEPAEEMRPKEAPDNKKEEAASDKQHPADRMGNFAVEEPKLVSRQGRQSRPMPSSGWGQIPPQSNTDSVGGFEKSEIKIEPVVRIQRCKSLAILGTMSDAGKSIMTAGLCRVLTNHGVRVAPFKGQNMSNNAAPALLPDKDRKRRLYKSFQTAIGGEFPSPLENRRDTGYGEIGTAQSLQAEACRLVPRVEMNPVLLKSGGQNEKGEFLCSVFVLGQQVARETYGDLGKRTTDLRTMVLESHEALAEATECEVILMEGAGSCTELNLMERDIVNLPLVRALGCPWLLVANIDCGGVFAQIVGTQMCVSKRDWSLCVGIIVNKLRGEAKYFEPGPKMIEDMVGKPVFVVPFLADLHLPEEDGVGIERRLAWESSGHHPEDNENVIDAKPVVVVVAYPNIAISDEICPLEADPRFRVQWRRRRLPRPYPHTTSVVLPGSRLTRQDLKWLHDSGWSAFLRNHVAAGGSILGLCGGYQMLGWSVDDPHAVEGLAGSRQGLGLLPIRTKIALPELKVVSPRFGRLYPKGPRMQGYELHCGQSQVAMNLGDSLRDQICPLIVFDDGKTEGMCARRVRGTYVHGILWSPEVRVACLVPDIKQFPKLKDSSVHDRLDRLAEHLESCGLDFDTLHGMISSHRNQQA